MKRLGRSKTQADCEYHAGQAVPRRGLAGRRPKQRVRAMMDSQSLEEARRVEDPTLLENTMQVGRRPTQLGAWQIALKVPRRGTSCQPLIIPLNPR